MSDKLTSFVKVKLSITPEGGTKVTTDAVFSLSGLGSTRKTSKKTLLNDKTLLAVGAKEYDSLNFSLPYSETSDEFHDVAVAQYDANKQVSLEIEFNNPVTPSTGTGTKITGNSMITSYKPDNDDDSIVSTFTTDWDGEPVTTKAN